VKWRKKHPRPLREEEEEEGNNEKKPPSWK
jgi:hypothetical protein